jgi:hypothetical protein
MSSDAHDYKPSRLGNACEETSAYKVRVRSENSKRQPRYLDVERYGSRLLSQERIVA